MIKMNEIYEIWIEHNEKKLKSKYIIAKSIKEAGIIFYSFEKIKHGIRGRKLKNEEINEFDKL